MPQDKLDPLSLPADEPARRKLAARLQASGEESRRRGELISAALYASDALMLFPNDASLLAFADGVASASPDPLSVVPVATGAIHPATAALRARILAGQHKLKDALALIGQVIDVAPNLEYLEWVRGWLTPQALDHLGYADAWQTILRPIFRLCLQVPAPPSSDDPRLPNVNAAVAILAIARSRFPDQAIVYYAEASARRRVQDPSGALAVAHEGLRRFPQDARLHSAALLACGDAKQPDQAMQHARQAMQIDPNDLAPLHDVAWAFTDAGRHQEAASLFQELLARDPRYPGADAGFHFARFKGTGNPEDRQRLLALRDQKPWDRRVRRLTGEIEPIVYYYNYLPEPGDATAKGAATISRELAAVLRCCGAGAQIGYVLESNYLESPSVPLALDVSIRALGGGGANMEVKPDAIQTPDPRVEKANVAYRLWKYEGTTATRVYPPAQDQVKDAIASIAAQVFRQDVWEPAARSLAQRLGPQWVHGVLAVMTDPPPPPASGAFDGIFWTYRCQVAAAVVLSHLDPWSPQGTGRTAIYSLVYGSTDWTTAAGIIAFGWRAKKSPEVRHEAEQVFAWLRGQVPEKGFTCWEAVLAFVWLGLGGHPPELEASLKAWIDDHLRTVHLKGAARPPERRYGGLTLAEYAEFTWERDRILQGGVPAGPPPPALVQLCQRFKVPLPHPRTGTNHPYIDEWNEAIDANPRLSEAFAELQRDAQLLKMGVAREEIAALDHIRDGNMDMHLRMAQAQAAQREVGGGGGDPDPVLFPGQPVARLSDYVKILKGMQAGNLAGALAPSGLDMISYGSVAAAWGAKMAADPSLTEKFNRMMTS